MAARQANEPTSVWERPEPPGRAAQSPLSRAAIVRAAIALADADGLEQVSLRKVAAALDAGPMRLYGYLSTKEELLDLMVDEVYGEIPLSRIPASEPGDWRAALRFHAEQIRLAAHRHEWFAELLGGRRHLGPNALAVLEASLAVLDGVPGFADVDRLIQARGTVQAYVVGAVRSEIAERRTAGTTGLDEQQWQLAADPYLRRMLDTGRYPVLARVVQDGTHRDADATFRAGLTAVFDGLVSPS